MTSALTRLETTPDLVDQVYRSLLDAISAGTLAPGQRITQEELAGMVGASRERVNKAIASFIRLGWIDQHERHYTILKRDALELRAR